MSRIIGLGFIFQIAAITAFHETVEDLRTHDELLINDPPKDYNGSAEIQLNGSHKKILIVNSSLLPEIGSSLCIGDKFFEKQVEFFEPPKRELVTSNDFINEKINRKKPRWQR